MISTFTVVTGIIFSITYGIFLQRLSQSRSNKLSQLLLFVTGFFSLIFVMTLLMNLGAILRYWLLLFSFLLIFVLTYLLTPYFFGIKEEELKYEKIKLSKKIVMPMFFLYGMIAFFLGTGINIGGVEGNIYFLASFIMTFVLLAFLPLWFFISKEEK